MRFLSLNINGVKSKLENQNCMDLFRDYDVICLSEVKCTYPFALQGFYCIRSLHVPGEENRGGTAVLVRNYLWPKVYDVQCLRDQVWFRLDNIKDLLFGAIYIPPRDSPYFSLDSFSCIHEMARKCDGKVLMMGDFNARMDNLSVFNDPKQSISYTQNSDNGTNQNGKDLADLCVACQLKPINHMTYKGKMFDGNLTFKRRSTWISQLDWAITSQATVNVVDKFEILQLVPVPTDHAPLALQISHPSFCASELLLKATQLGLTTAFSTKASSRRSLKIQNIDILKFAENIPPADQLWQITDVQSLCDRISDFLYETAVKSETVECRSDGNQPIRSCHERWLKIIGNQDAKQLWQSINWHGQFSTPNDVLCQPSDDCFCEHYENLLNPIGAQPLDYQVDYQKYVPILDSPISPREVIDSLDLLKSNKSAGVDGIPPGLLKLLPDSWVMLLTFLFNCIFFNAYPLGWSKAKVFNVFKKGNRLDPSNYRGISVMVSLAKLYDTILSQRFRAWYRPRREQAGAQKQRGCTEQILVLRLLIDIARKKKWQLYVLFVDYKKAYDMVDRRKLMQYLDRRGCGSTFLMALQSSYAMTKGQIGECCFSATAGVRQGACTSCPLFVFFIEPTIDAVSNCGPDGWLENLHSMLLMDDTVILATTREQMATKLTALKGSADDIGMIINSSKTQYICVNTADKQPFRIDGLTISHTDVYTYLGTPISATSVTNQLKAHLQQKTCHTMKFCSFLAKNYDAPFFVKKTVWRSALQAAIFYSCDTWLTRDLKPAESVYNTTLKYLLGVRSSTCNDIAFVESGEYGAKGHIRHLQASLIRKITDREDYRGSYFEYVFDLAQNVKCPAGKVLQDLLAENGTHKDQYQETVLQAVRSSTSTRRVAYRNMNPTLSVSSVYSNSPVPEHSRIAFTRFRLSSHNLPYEMGHWAHVPPELRLCSCGSVQLDSHILLECVNTQPMRLSNKISNCACLNDLFQNNDVMDVCNLCYEILKL